VLLEVVNHVGTFSLLDPVNGRGAKLGQAEVTEGGYDWSLSADGKKVAVPSISSPNRIAVLDLLNQQKKEIEVKGWQVQSTNWAPDNQHLYIIGSSADIFAIAEVSPDTTVKTLGRLTLGREWAMFPSASPDGRYLGFILRQYNSNAFMLESN
jgi:DNA-binding beta-propeller fold protein YncE